MMNKTQFETMYNDCIEAIRSYTLVQPDSTNDWAYQEYLINCSTLLQLEKRLSLPDLRFAELEQIYHQIDSICRVSK